MNFEIENIIHQIGLPLLKKIGCKFHFRCYVCHDSRTNERKKRGWIIEKNGRYFYHCYNCGYSRPLHVFLKEHCYHLYLEYLKLVILKKDTPHKEEIPKVIERPYEKIEDLDSIADLNPDHRARKYLSDRQIPFKFFTDLYFSYNYQAWINERIPGKIEHTPDVDERIVLPIHDLRGSVVGVQGRALNKSAIRYLTILFDENVLNMSGLNRVKRNEQIIVTEGFIDSLFLKNAISMNSSNVDLNRLVEISDQKNFVFAFDNERRNKEVKERMLKVINHGFKIVLWPESVYSWGKDINVMILNGKSVDQIEQVMAENIYSGIVAKTRLKIS